MECAWDVLTQHECNSVLSEWDPASLLQRYLCILLKTGTAFRTCPNIFRWVKQSAVKLNLKESTLPEMKTAYLVHTMQTAQLVIALLFKYSTISLETRTNNIQLYFFLVLYDTYWPFAMDYFHHWGPLDKNLWKGKRRIKSSYFWYACCPWLAKTKTGTTRYWNWRLRMAIPHWIQTLAISRLETLSCNKWNTAKNKQ